VTERSSVPKSKPAEQQVVRPDEKDPEFEPWLDGRLKSMYDAILSEPLPDEILKLLKSSKRG
jgi:hypothetical protein